MTARSPAFERYVDRAREGRNALWRLVVGTLIVVVIWIGLLAGTFTAGALLLHYAAGPRGGASAVVDLFLRTPQGMAIMLGSFAGIWIALFIVVRLLHGRRLRSVLGSQSRISWHNLIRGLVVALGVSGVLEAAFTLADPSLGRSDIPLSAWLLWSIPILSLLLVQTSAEELLFRGYLLQSLAARFHNPIVWAGAPALLFTLLHWSMSAGGAMNAAMLVAIAAFAVAASVLVYRTGDLGAAIGLHLGVNTFSILFVSRMSVLDGAALLKGRPMDMEAFSALQALWLAATSVATFALMLWLLLSPRSPLRVRVEA